jgi:hypothetical protein
MSEQVLALIESKNKLFLKNKKYIKSNDWSKTDNKNQAADKLSMDSIKSKQSEFKLQNDIVTGMLQHIGRFIKKVKGGELKEKADEFLNLSLEIVEMHTNRVEAYIDKIDISEIPSMNIRSDELKFHNEISKEIELIEDKVTALGIRNSKVANTTDISFLNEAKAPLSMHWVLSEIYPEINRKLTERGIDLDAPATNSELYIYMKNVPEWDTDLHYWEQKKETLEFYASEFQKLRQGVVIDGYYISPWMYYHMNVFVTPIPHSVYNEKSKRNENVDKIMNPPLRDSDLIIFENHEKQKTSNTLFMFIAATRRAAKTTLETSKLGHAATIGKKELLCAGGSTKDLNQIAKNFKIDMQYKNPAFAVQNTSNDWKNKVELGLKTKSNKTILLSTLNIVNTDSGNNVEILAGYTPDEFLYDEAMKGKFLEPLQGLKPALKGAEGLIRCFGILSATGGDEALSADGLKVLSDPKTNDTLPMDWDLLERGVPDECKTWKEDKLKSFTTFIPGQMCVDMPKLDSNVAEYIGRPDADNLKKIKIKITDWVTATEKIQESRDKLIGNKIAYNKEVIYIPLKPSEITMSGNINRFPVLEAKRHKQHLLDSGEWDRRREIYRDSNGKVQWTISTKELAEFPHKGGIVDAPCLFFEDPPEQKPVWGTYTAGFDDFASEESASDSVATFTIMKNEILGDPFSKRIVATISFRPSRHPEVWDKWLMLMELYHLEETCFGENFNYEIKTHLDRYHLSEKYLAPSLDFSANFTIPNNGKRKTGWNPTTTKRFLFDLFVEYCNESFDVEMEDGSTKIIKGVQLINDIYLLDEIIQYSPNLNVDRITSAMGALGYGFFLRSSQRWKVLNYSKDKVDNTPKVRKERHYNPYSRSNRRVNPYKNR